MAPPTCSSTNNVWATCHLSSTFPWEGRRAGCGHKVSAPTRLRTAVCFSRAGHPGLGSPTTVPSVHPAFPSRGLEDKPTPSPARRARSCSKPRQTNSLRLSHSSCSQFGVTLQLMHVHSCPLQRRFSFAFIWWRFVLKYCCLELLIVGLVFDSDLQSRGELLPLVVFSAN